ncbi:pulmonary surfactant-associated protein B [Apteryx mantelli]|uniref:Pulmonary surfactant-associated protein B n=1 Tax=Apteryx mantelli TaxID=2696672 RepID=A0ABM4FTS8_9AVES
MALPPSPPRALSLLLALLCASPGLGGPGVAAGRCGAQPHTWCQSWETALRCGALGHCARHGWAPGAKDMCADCQEIVSLLTRMANESAAKAAVEGFLRQECTALPVPTMVSPCQRLVHEYFSLLTASLEGHLKPAVVCARLDLCPGEPGGAVEPVVLPRDGVPGTRLQVGDLPVPLPLCWLCRTFIARAEATIPKEKLATGVARLCQVLPAAAAGACRCLAERYTILLLDTLLGKLGPRLLCSALFSCGTQDDCAPVAPGGPRAPTGAHGDKGWDGSALGQQELGLGRVPPEPAPNSEPCALGPAYWCSSAEAARRCQAVQHCQAHVWV